MEEIYRKKQLFILLAFLVFTFVGIVSLYVGITTKKIVSIKYQENNDIDYKVYLKENDYFEEEYIDKGKTYITSLIDHINIDFKYNIDFNQKVKANYKYKVVAQIEANKADNDVGNYWTKKYDITNNLENNVKDVTNYSINQSINVDYNKYNELLNDFKKSVGLSNSSGVLKVYLEVNSTIDGEEINIPVKSDLVLKLPLSELAIEATIDSDITNNVKEIKKSVKDNDKIYGFLKIFGIFCSIIALLLLLVFLKNRKVFTTNYKYELELKKILTTYDSIIVNIKDLPDLEGYNVIKVESFDELIDAHSEIRMPINYYKGDKFSAFLLLNDNIAWKYILLNKSKRRSKKK